MTIPEHRPLTRRRVDEDDRELIRSPGHRARAFERHAFLEKTLLRELAEHVVAKASQVARPPAETRADRRSRGHLSAGKPGEPVETLLRVLDRMFGDDRQKIDAVQAQAHDIE